MIFIDGTISPNTLSEPKLYSSIYSNPKHNFIEVELDPEIQKRINYQSYQDIINFYNKRTTSFEENQKETGVNIWFLEKFRLYFYYRNFMLKIESIKSFLEKNEHGKLFTNDKRLFHFF